jgi:NTP pyrophosphatase (non-canonical NTP hydrolase)
MNLQQYYMLMQEIKGFWDDNNGTIFYLKQLAMVHSEVSEVLEAIRKEKGDDQVVEELADIIIRVLDLYAGLKLEMGTRQYPLKSP